MSHIETVVLPGVIYDVPKPIKSVIVEKNIFDGFSILKKVRDNQIQPDK